MLINFDSELGIFEQALVEDANGEFNNMDVIDPVDGIPFKEKAVDVI